MAATRRSDGSRRATAVPSQRECVGGCHVCAASKQACERLPRQHETAAACGVSATNRQGGRVPSRADGSRAGRTGPEQGGRVPSQRHWR